MSFGDVDTLTLTFDKLRYISSGYDQYNESFAQLISLYKDGKMGEKEYRDAMIDGVLKYSALEFLALKAAFEIKKAINRGVFDATHVDAMAESSSHSLSSFFVAKNLPSKSTSEEKAVHHTCPKCGSSTKKSDKFCTNCGNTMRLQKIDS